MVTVSSVGAAALDSCIQNELLWFMATPDLASWSAISRECNARMRCHKSWESRVLRSFGSTFGDSLLALNAEWHSLYLQLARISRGVAEAKLPHRSARSFPSHRYDVDAGPDFLPRWTLVLPAADGGAGGVCWYDGVACRLQRLSDLKPLVLWKPNAVPSTHENSATLADVGPCVRGVVVHDRLYLLTDQDRVHVFDHYGASRGALTLPIGFAEGSGFDLVKEASDLFASTDGSLLIVETTYELLIWECASRRFMHTIAHVGVEKDQRIQGRPVDRDLVATWVEEEGDEVQIWTLRQQSDQPAARWRPSEPGRTLAHVGCSVGHCLLGILDTANEFHIVRVGRTTSTFSDQVLVEHLSTHCIFNDAHGPATLLPCSLSWHGGILSFVEAEDFSSLVRVLHVWDFLDDAGASIVPQPKRWKTAFLAHGGPTMSVPRPFLRRFCIIKSFSDLHSQGCVTVRVIDLRRHGLCVYAAHAKVQDTSLFRRCHSLTEHFFALWMPIREGPEDESAMIRPPECSQSDVWTLNLVDLTGRQSDPVS